jgi:hypothetical protein
VDRRRALVILLLLAAFVAGCARGPRDETSGPDDGPRAAIGPTAARLRVAAGRAIITPTPANHPETIYLGGIYPPRLATGIHDDLAASALVLRRGDEHVVLVVLDFLGFSRSRIREVQEVVAAALAADGFDPDHLLIASTHTHEAPDTLGVFGPNLWTSGVSREYMAFVQGAIAELVIRLWGEVVPVTMRAAVAAVDDPGSNHRALADDLREPIVTVPFLAAARFDADDGRAVATLVNWHVHPEVMIESTLVSSDFPGWVRERVESVVGGSCVYLSGAIGGLATPTGVDVPARDADGDPVTDADGDPVYLRDGTWDKARSLGFEIADRALAALEDAPAWRAPDLSVVVRPLVLPVSSPILIVAFIARLIEFDFQDLITGDPATCGWFGCTDERLGLVRVGPVALLTAPGETFPETFVGRAESVIDFGAPWGPFPFPAMDGLSAAMGAAVPMHAGLCGEEIGYLIPESDFHPRGHPDYYEEDLYLGRDTESVYWKAALALLAERPGNPR